MCNCLKYNIKEKKRQNLPNSTEIIPNSTDLLKINLIDVSVQNVKIIYIKYVGGRKMCNNEMFKDLENGEMMFLDGGALSVHTIDTNFWNNWFSDLFEAFTS